jgi:polysaccharide biosynthesis protein PslH
VKILFLTQVLPFPLDAGPKVRAYYALRRLAAQGHAVTLVSFVRAMDGAAALDHLRSLCDRVLTVPLRRARWRDGAAAVRSLLTGEPLLIARDRIGAMTKVVRSLAAEVRFDAVHADQLWMAPYALAAQATARQAGWRPQLVLDQHNAVHLIPERLATAARDPLTRLAYRRERARMADYEARTCLAFDQVVTVTQDDRDCLLQLYRNGRRPNFAAVIPICIDPEAVPAGTRQAAGPELLFVGGMHWPPNADGVTWFADEVLPLVRKGLPNARFTAVGKQPPRRPGAAPLAGLHLSGYVAELQPFWERSAAFVVPLRAGGGMRVKILDAWARGLPVVSTTIGAEGLAWAHGENLLIADTAADFAAAVTRVLTNPDLAARLAQGGRATVERHYDWRTAYAAWDGIYPR